MLELLKLIAKLISDNESFISGIIGLAAIFGGTFGFLKRKAMTRQYHTSVIFQKPTMGSKLIGRKRISRIFYQKLKDRHIVWISGMGGIGKSHIAEFIAFRYFKKSALLFKWRSDYKMTLTSSPNVEIAGAVSSMEDKFRIVYGELLRISKRTLLIFDGADQFEIDDISFFDQLATNRKLFIIITTRLQGIENSSLLMPVERREGCRLFSYYYGEKCSEYIGVSLVQLSGRHSLTIKLLACYAKTNHLTPEELLAKLEADRNSPVSALDSVVKIENGGEYEKPIDCITRLLRLSFSNGVREHIIAILSLFPDMEWDSDSILSICEGVTIKDVYRLYDESWLNSHDRKIFKIHPVIGEVVRNLMPLSREERRNLTRKLIEWVKYPQESFSTKSSHYSAMYVELFLTFQRDNPIIENGLLYYYLGRLENDWGNAKEAQRFLEHAQIIAEAQEKSDEAYILQVMIMSEQSEAFWFMGEDYFDKAIEREMKAREKSSNCPDIKYYIYSTIQLALYLSETNIDKNLNTAERYISEIYSKIDTQPVAYGRISMMMYIHYGIILFKQKKYDLAKNQFAKCIQYCREYQLCNNIDYAKALSSMGRVYITLYEQSQDKQYLQAALKSVEEAIEIKKSLLNEDHPSLGVSYHVYSTPLQKAGKIRRAIKYELKALDIRLKDPDKMEYLASSYLNLGDLYWEKGGLRMKNTQQYYGEALKIYLKIGTGFESEIERCKERLERRRHL